MGAGLLALVDGTSDLGGQEPGLLGAVCTGRLTSEGWSWARCVGVVDGVFELRGVRSQALWACVDGASDLGKQELGFLGLCGQNH